jgi:hypothetical protein
MNERHHALPPPNETGNPIMNNIELCSTFARRFATWTTLVAVLAATGCAMERQSTLAAAHANVGGLTTATLPMQNECIACEP